MENLVTIAEFAKMCRTTVRTIRFYDQLNLIKPVKVDQWTKYRYYSPLQTRDYFRIKLLQNFEIPLKSIKTTLNQKSSASFFEGKIKEVKQELNQKKKEYEVLKRIKVLLFGNTDLKGILKVENLGPYTLFGAYFPTGRYDRIDNDIEEVREMAKKLGIKTGDKEFTFYLDPDTYKPKDTRLENMLIVKSQIPKKINLPKNYFVKKLPRIRTLVLNYRGPFELITLLYERLHELEITKKYKVDLPFDIYVGGPSTPLSPYDYKTKICFPMRS